MLVILFLKVKSVQTWSAAAFMNFASMNVA